MAIFKWLKELVEGEEEEEGLSRAEARARRRADYLPQPRRKEPFRRRWQRPKAQYDPQRLDRFTLPHCATIEDLARELGVTVGKLHWLTWPNTGRRDDHYVRREAPKRSGGKRLLCVPKPRTRQAQDWIVQRILNNIPINACAHGFIKGRSIVTNAREHVGKSIVLNVDLQDFFPNISIATVVGLFEWMGYPKDVAWHLAMLCTCPYGRRRALPQGSPTSPAISNLICWKLDRRLTGLAKRFKARYTRYADDLTFSGDANFALSLGNFLPLLKGICEDEGFRINPRKTRFMRRCARQTVTGLVVNDKPNITRKELRTLRAILHNCKAKGVSSQNPDNDPLFRERLLGKISLVRMVNPQQASKLMADFDQVYWYQS